MKLTNKLFKDFGMSPRGAGERETVQQMLDGGDEIKRERDVVSVGLFCCLCRSPGEAVKFAAALNKCRRPIHLIKQDLDKDWAARVKERDQNICALCGKQGDKIGDAVEAHVEVDEEAGVGHVVKARVKKDVLTAHHWLKTKARAGMARWARACGVTVHFAEHIHILHENPCWVDLDNICARVSKLEGGMQVIEAAIELSKVAPTEAAVRKLWAERNCWACAEKAAR